MIVIIYYYYYQLPITLFYIESWNICIGIGEERYGWYDDDDDDDSYYFLLLLPITNYSFLYRVLKYLYRGGEERYGWYDDDGDDDEIDDGDDEIDDDGDDDSYYFLLLFPITNYSFLYRVLKYLYRGGGRAVWVVYSQSAHTALPRSHRIWVLPFYKKE